MRERRIAATVAAAFLCGAVAAAAAGGGDRGEGPAIPVHEVRIPACGDGPASFSEASGLQGFVVRVGNGAILTPAVDGKRVFAGSGAEMRAFDALTGRPLWRTGVDDAGPTAPAVSDGDVYFNTASCTLYAIEASTGQRKWSRWIAGTVASTPTVSGGRVFVTGPSKDGRWKLECYAAGNGSLLFARPLPADALSAPVATEDRVFLGLAGGKVLAFDHKGKAVWESDEGALAAPWPEGPRLLVACGDESGRPGLRTLDAATGERRDRGIATPSSPGSGDAPAPAPENGMFAGGGGGAGGGGIPRPAPPPAPAPSSDGPGGPKDRDPSPPAGPTPGPAAGGSGGGLAGPFGFEGPRPCVIASTAALAAGSELLVQGLEGGEPRRIPLGAEAAGAPVAAKSVFVQATRDGRLLGFDPVTGARRFEVRLTSDGNPIPLASSPAVWRGRAYIGTQDGRLVVVDLPEPSADGWPMWGGSPRRAK